MRSNYFRRPSPQALELFQVIEHECQEHGECNNLFNAAVRIAGHEYHAAHNRLRSLSRNGLVTVKHKGNRLTVNVCANKLLTLEESK